MVYYATNDAKLVSLFALVLMLGSVWLTATNASAVSNIDAVICRSNQGSTLTVSRPQSDSVINVSKVELTGTVSQSSQLEIYVDGAFSGVEPLTMGVESYTTTVDVAPGAHTIKLVAIDICQISSADASVVLTYQPVSSPSAGRQVSTTVGDEVTGMEAVSSPQGSLIERFALLPLIKVGESLNLITRDVSGTKNSYTNITRFLVILAGILMMIYSNRLKNVMIGASSWIHAGPRLVGVLRKDGRRVLMIIGAVIILSVFIF
jgi:hypothetical protein